MKKITKNKTKTQLSETTKDKQETNIFPFIILGPGRRTISNRMRTLVLSQWNSFYSLTVVEGLRGRGEGGRGKYEGRGEKGEEKGRGDKEGEEGGIREGEEEKREGKGAKRDGEDVEDGGMEIESKRE